MGKVLSVAAPALLQPGALGHYPDLGRGVAPHSHANIYAPNIGAPKYIKQLVLNLNREMGSNTIIIEDYKSPIASMSRSSRQKVNKETAALNETLDPMDLINIERAIHPNVAEYILKCKGN